MKYLGPLLILLLLSSHVQAQPSPDPPGYEKPIPVETIPPGDDLIKPLRKGDKAPFDGQLFNIDTSIRWGFWLQQYRYRLVADSKRYQQLCRVETGFRDKKLEIEKSRNDKIDKDLRDRLLRSEKARLAAEEDSRNPPWYSTTEFGMVIGAVATLAVVAVAVWALEARE